MFVRLWFEYSKAFVTHGSVTFDTSFTRLHGMFLKVWFFLLSRFFVFSNMSSVLTCSFIIWTLGWFLNFLIAISTGLPNFVVSPNIRFFGQIFRDLTAFLEAVAQKCSVKKLLLKLLRKHLCQRLLFVKVAGLTPFLKEHLRWMHFQKMSWSIQPPYQL